MTAASLGLAGLNSRLGVLYAQTKDGQGTAPSPTKSTLRLSLMPLLPLGMSTGVRRAGALRRASL